MTKTSHRDDIWIEDERLSDLLRFLPYIRTTRRTDGRVHLNFKVPQCDAAPFFRAMRRIEGRLLIEDGERLIDDPAGSVRTNDERATHAMVELIGAVCDAAEAHRN